MDKVVCLGSGLDVYCWLLLEKLLMVESEVVDDDGEKGRCSVLFCLPTIWWRPISFNSSIASYASRFSVRILLNGTMGREMEN